MGCNCKKVTDKDEVDNVINVVIDEKSKKKLDFFEKLGIIYQFTRFYFYFVVTSIVNFIANDRLEPDIPKRVIDSLKNG